MYKCMFKYVYEYRYKYMYEYAHMYDCMNICLSKLKYLQVCVYENLCVFLFKACKTRALSDISSIRALQGNPI